MAQFFDVDLLEMKCAALETSLRAGRQASEIVEAGLPLLDQAVGEENYGVVARLVKDLRISATNARLDAARRQTAERVLAQAENAKQEHDKLKTDLKTLADNPNDAKANLAVGKFHCVARGDWEEGLPLLARGSDAALKALAEKDLTNPAEPDAQIALGDDWRKYAGQANSKSLKAACQKRACSWYQQAAAHLKGAKLKNVQQSIAALAKALPELQNPWWQFGTYSASTPDMATGYLRVQPPNSIATRQCYRGPLDITVVARSMKTDLNISMGTGGRLTIGQNFNGNSDRLQIFRPDGATESFGSQAVEKAITLPANSAFTIRWQVTTTGMKVWLDGEVVFEETREFDRGAKNPVQIHCGAAPIELKSVVVRRGPDK